MAKRKVPAAAGQYRVWIEIGGTQDWAHDFRDRFNDWTLKMATEGPSESVAVLPSIRVSDETEDELATVTLEWVDYSAESTWDAMKDAMEEVAGVIIGGLLEIAAPMRLSAEPEWTIGRDVEIDDDDPSL
jgi:hypothetical protein